MNYTQDQAKKIYQSAKDKGLDPDVVMAKLVAKGAVIEGIDMNQAREFASRQSPQESGYLQRVGSGLKEQALRAAQGIETGATAMEQGLNMTDANGIITPKGVVTAVGGLLRSGLRAAGSAANAISTPIVEAPGVKQATETVVGGAMKGLQELPGGAEAFQKLRDLAVKNPEIAKDVEDIFNLVTTGGGAKVAEVGVEGVAKAGAEQVVKGMDTLTGLTNKVADIPKNFIDNVTLSKIDSKTKTILSETPVEKLNLAIKQGEEALADPRKFTPLENAGLQLKQADKLIKNDLSTIGSQKAELLNSVGKTRTPGIAVRQIEKIKPLLQSKLTDSERSLVNQYLSELESLGKNPSASSVDATIDKLQATLFEKKGGVAIPTTPRIKSFINKSLGELNTELKTTVDDALGSDAYSAINSQYASKLNLFNKLNKALGEEGLKGGSLAKRFFSPSDAGTKQLFSDIKTYYGIDLAQDVTLAKFVMDTLGDVRATSMLELPPTTPAGFISKGVDMVEKKLTSPKKVFEKARSISK